MVVSAIAYLYLAFDILTIPIDESDSESLVGMSLMKNYQLTVQVLEEDSVEIRKINTV
jgi:hypothetical protein